MVEDKPRFTEDVSKNALDKPPVDFYHETSVSPPKMEEDGGEVRYDPNGEAVVPPASESSLGDPPHGKGATFLQDITAWETNDKDLVEVEKTTDVESNLLETASSNFENICLSREHFEEISANVGAEKSEENANILSNVDKGYYTITEQSSFHPSVPTEDTASLTTVTKCNSLMENLNLHSNVVHALPQVSSFLNVHENGEEASIEDSCEPQQTIGHSKSLNEIPNSSQSTKSQNIPITRPPTLSEDSRLVKIPLPTSSMNIMQSNAQFLNKSRNFLNFITEKSTNIMEKTLLPQNIAVRYNSLLKLSDGAYAVEKKQIAEDSIPRTETSADPTPVAEQGSTQKSPATPNHMENRVMTPGSANESPVNSRTFENVPTTNSNISNYFSNHSESPSSIIALGSHSQEQSLPTETETTEISLTNPEETTKSLQQSSGHEGEEQESKGSLGNDSVDQDNLLPEATNGFLRNPVYLTLVRDYAKAREDKLKLIERVKHLEQRNCMLEAQNSGELFNVQLEALEKTVERLSGELRASNANQEELSREYASANKERESMVMKYAVSEKQLIDTQRARDYAERRFKEIAKDHELLQKKLVQTQRECSRICSILDTKCRELTDSQKELERLKEDVNVRDVKLKWTQNKLKSEMEAQKETQQKLDKATARINDMKEECEQVRRESQEMIRKFQQSEENKAVSLDHQLKEQQARLILERHVTEDKEMLRIKLQKEVDLLKNRQQTLIEENNKLSLKIQDLEMDRLNYESKLSELKIVTDQRQKEIVDLTAKVSHLETLKLQLIHKEQCLASNEAEVERLRQVNQELQVDMDCCRQREAHMLDFTQKLTDKNVRLQSEFTAIEAKAAQLEQEQGPLREGIAELKSKVKSLEENLAHEKKKRLEECEILARHLAEQQQLAQTLSQKYEDSQGEIAVLRRKQQISVKEMSRELQQCRKKLEAYESASPSSNSLDPTSRTGSNASLNTGETPNGMTSDHGGNSEQTLQSAELDRQSLIDRILKMQKINVRRAEKLDFLEEHTRTLVAELQKKTKIIQNYILHENFDAMGSNERDRHKAELARHGGIMASVYNHKVSDDNMTLELSLEINQKLQAVLEDALLKNITLKDNIDTLGEEIARLTIKNQQLLQQKAK